MLNPAWCQRVGDDQLTEVRQYLRHLCEVALVDVPGDAVVGVRHVLAGEQEGVGCGQQREQLVLLGLVVQDLGLRFSGEGKNKTIQ